MLTCQVEMTGVLSCTSGVLTCQVEMIGVLSHTILHWF